MLFAPTLFILELLDVAIEFVEVLSLRLELLLELAKTRKGYCQWGMWWMVIRQHLPLHFLLTDEPAFFGLLTFVESISRMGIIGQHHDLLVVLTSAA